MLKQPRGSVILTHPSGQNGQKKQSEGVALKIQCRVVKNTLLQTSFGDFAHWECSP